MGFHLCTHPEELIISFGFSYNGCWAKARRYNIHKCWVSQRCGTLEGIRVSQVKK